MHRWARPNFSGRSCTIQLNGSVCQQQSIGAAMFTCLSRQLRSKTNPAGTFRSYFEVDVVITTDDFSVPFDFLLWGRDLKAHRTSICYLTWSSS